MRIFITHADTPYRMYTEHLDFCAPTLHISFPTLAPFERADVVFAFWSHHSWGDEEAWNTYLAMQEAFVRKTACIPPCIHPLYAVEDARMLGTDTAHRLDLLCTHGVKILTPLWRGVSVVGGAYDTDVGLSPLGKTICTLALARGMILDISHASEASAYEMLRISSDYGTPVIASHSNFFSVYPHKRNITDDLAKEVARCGGIIGLSFVPSHLGTHGSINDVVRHLEYGISLGLEHHLVLGTDYDGTDNLPRGLSHGVQDLPRLARHLYRRRFSQDVIEHLFWRNATAFFGHLQ